MAKIAITTGKRFGFWEVLGTRVADKHVPCVCTLCKKQYQVSKANLRSGSSTKCKACSGKELSIAGIEARRKHAKKRGERAVGKKYGNWTVTKPPSHYGAGGVKKSNKVALCECTCGAKAYMFISYLRSSRVGKKCWHKSGVKK